MPYFLIIFSGAFLLFQVQPLIAKMILPLFGGGAAIWTACLLFFQAFLLLGYLYSHYLTKILSMTKQVVIHTVFLLVSLYFLPITLVEMDYVVSTDSPMFDILELLMLSIGAPYIMLATTGPLVQRWLSYIDVTRLPYKLYALSNIASLLALLSYPFLIEPLLTTLQQSTVWSLFYLVFILLFVAFGLQMVKQKNLAICVPLQQDKTRLTNNIDTLLWLLLSAVGVILLVSTTNALTQNIPPVPFLWILPLSIYLLTYIINFHSSRWYVRWYWFVIFVLASFAAILLFFIGSQFDIVTQIVLYSLILLSACMICHGELAQLKPKADRLTLFYLNLSFGGFLGSFFVAFIAQNLFSRFYEFPLSIFLVFVLFIASVLFYKTQSKKQIATVDTIKTLSTKASFISQQNLLLLSAAVSLLLFTASFIYLNNLFSLNNVTSMRNFYGILSVKDVEINDETQRRLIDGTTAHGSQYLQPEKKHIPLSYYRINTGVALAIKKLGIQGSINVGIVGLGAGTLAAYGRINDQFTFYELNPNVAAIANSHFSYLQQSKAKVDIVLGDGRQSLHREFVIDGSQQYQLLVIDAFSGDSIPVHLLTKESFELYLSHLDTDGILAVHISNSHLNLAPLIRGLADNFNKKSVYFKTSASYTGQHEVEWILINNKQRDTAYDFSDQADKWPVGSEETIVWTDNYSNLLSVIK